MSSQHENEMPKKGPALRIILSAALVLILAVAALYLFRDCGKECPAPTEPVHQTMEKAPEVKPDSAATVKVDSAAAKKPDTLRTGVH